MDTYRIPLVWQMYGHCDIDANSLEEAIEIALGPDTPLPDGSYVDDSVAVDYEVLELEQGKRNRTLTKEELRAQLQHGRVLSDLLAFGPGQDFIDECGGDMEKAECLFYYCDWQHPSSAVDELEDDPG